MDEAAHTMDAAAARAEAVARAAVAAAAAAAVAAQEAAAAAAQATTAPAAISRGQLQLWEETQRCGAVHTHGCDCRCCRWTDELPGGHLCRACRCRRHTIEDVISWFWTTES